MINYIIELIRLFMASKPQNKPVTETEDKFSVDTKPPSEFDIELLQKILIFDEGELNRIYKDSLGYYTIGIGHLLTKSSNYSDALYELNKLVGRPTDGTITKAESFRIFEKDLDNVVYGVKNNKLLNDVYYSLDEFRRLALLNMVFQMGVSGVANFKNSMRMAKEKRWEDLEKNLKLSLWYKQTTNRANRVIKLFSYGDLSGYKGIL